jgi:hypothetical protein
MRSRAILRRRASKLHGVFIDLRSRRDNFAQKETDERQFMFGASFGAGVKYALGNTDISVDYAYRTVRVFDANHVFSVKLGF